MLGTFSSTGAAILATLSTFFAQVRMPSPRQTTVGTYPTDRYRQNEVVPNTNAATAQPYIGVHTPEEKMAHVALTRIATVVTAE